MCADQSTCNYNASEGIYTCSPCPEEFFGSGYDYCAGKKFLTNYFLMVADYIIFLDVSNIIDTFSDTITNYREILRVTTIPPHSQWHFNVAAGDLVVNDEYADNDLVLTNVGTKVFFLFFQFINAF